MSWCMEQAEIVAWCKQYKGPLYHAVLCDPPYHLTSITERFGRPDSAPVKVKEFVDESGKKQGSSPFLRSSTGFLGATWDGGDVAFQPDTWRAIKGVMYPGAFGMAFSGSRGWHRMTCAIEDAGFIINTTVFLYCYFTGFPKATRIDTQIDQRPGVLGKMLEIKQYLEEAIKKCDKTQDQINTECGFTAVSYAKWRETEHPDPWRTTLPDWEQWQVMKKVIRFDDKYDLAIKNADREIIGQGKSGIGTAFGDGEWSGESAEEFDVTAPATDMAKNWSGYRYGGAIKPAVEPIIVFQKPYEGKPIESITKTGAGALNIDGGRIEWDTKSLENDTKRRQSPGTDITGGRYIGGTAGDYTMRNKESPSGRWPANFALSHLPECKEECVDGCPVKQLNEQVGGASRFFFNSNWNFEVAEGLLTSSPVRYCSKPSSEEKEVGLESLPEVLDENGKPKSKCIHPTVKPIALNKWLATLLLPPVAYAPRRILVPFAGVGSEIIGALHAGWDEVVGVEMQEEYVKIGKARLEHWAGIGKVEFTRMGTKVRIVKLEEFE